MTDNVAESIKRSGLIFEEHLKAHLCRDWGDELTSIESAASSPLAEVFDKGASSDVVLSYLKTQGPTLTFVTRMGFAKHEPAGTKTNFQMYEMDFTFRCSYLDRKGSLRFDCELEKLLKSASYIQRGISVVMPFYYVKARILEVGPDKFMLYDYAVAETQRLLEIIRRKDGVNWKELKTRIGPEGSVNGQPLGRLDCGLNFNKKDQKGFVYLKLSCLEAFGIPYFYKRFAGDQRD